MDESLRQSLIAGQQAGSRFALAQPDRTPMGLSGTQVGNRAGSSLEFREHREYELGDDLRRIDWSVYARSDRLHVKLFREEVSPHVDLLLDGSRSMNLPDTPKAAGSLALAAALAAAASNSSYTHNLYLASGGCIPVEGGNGMPLGWKNIAFDDVEPLDHSFGKMPPRWRPMSIRILISDLLWISDPAAVLQPMAANAAMVVVVQVLARNDIDPPERGSMRLVDSETGQMRDLFIDAAAQRRYREALARHQENWSKTAVRLGAVMRTIIADDLLKTWDLRPLVEAQILTVD